MLKPLSATRQALGKRRPTGTGGARRAAGTREAMGMRKRVIGVLQKAAAVREN